MQNHFLIFTLILSLFSPLKGESSNTVFLFDEYEISTGLSDQTLILSGNFLGGQLMDIATIQRDTIGTTHLNIFQFQKDQWQLALGTTLGQNILFVDVATINGIERLVTYSDGKMDWIDPISGEPSPLIKIPFILKADPKKNVPHVRIFHDLNGDGKDDIIAPSVDGFWIATQLTNGTFSPSVKIGPPEPFYNQNTFDEKRDYGDVGVNPQTMHWYLSRVHNFDYNLDGRSDLVFWNEDHFDVYVQNQDGSFAIDPNTFKTGVHFDSDGTYSIVFSFKESNTFSLLFGTRKSTNYTVLHSIQDMNSDGIPDMVTHSLTGRSVFKMKSRYIVHFGSATNSSIQFSKNPDTAANSHGKGGATQSGGYAHQWLKDIDGDGEVDIIRYDVKIGLTGIINVLLGRHLTINFEVHKMADGQFPPNPNGKKRLKAHVNIYDEKGGFFPFMRLGDITGDGLPELLIATKKDEVQIFLGKPNLNILNVEPIKVNIVVPKLETHTWLKDLNQDGKQDILMYHTDSDAHRLVIMVAK
ncbi:MAG: VCBS repeat-containing protein [Candidatus Marinimicrobia bacterium]|nr:VCBS repeat-containing protein [Candidatus Neomarinimicrobiota bacterium]